MNGITGFNPVPDPRRRDKQGARFKEIFPRSVEKAPLAPQKVMNLIFGGPVKMIPAMPVDIFRFL
jgi:hypothetical protein